MIAGDSQRTIQRKMKVPMRTLQRMMKRIEAWHQGPEVFATMLAKASKESMERTAKVEARNEEDREWLYVCLAAPQLFGRRDLWLNRFKRRRFLEGKG